MSRWKCFLLLAAVIGIGAMVALKFDSIRWRIEQVRGWALDVSNPTTDTLPTPVAAPTRESVGALPTAALISDSAADTATPTAPVAIETATAIPLIDPPEAVTLTAPKWVKQDINNCGPATLAMYLSYYGWNGTQKDIEAVVHPNQRDKNVRWDELVYYVKTHAGWLDGLFRVGGNVDEMKRFIANGYPVVIETGYEIDVGWVGHYLLLTGYDNAKGVFIVQDATGGRNRKGA